MNPEVPVDPVPIVPTISNPLGANLKPLVSVSAAPVIAAQSFPSAGGTIPGAPIAGSFPAAPAAADSPAHLPIPADPAFIEFFGKDQKEWLIKEKDWKSNNLVRSPFPFFLLSPLKSFCSASSTVSLLTGTSSTRPSSRPWYAHVLRLPSFFRPPTTRRLHAVALPSPMRPAS